MINFFHKLYEGVLYLSISFVTFSLSAYLIVFGLRFYPQFVNLTVIAQIIFFVSLLISNLVLWFVIFKKYKLKWLRKLVLLIIILFALFNALFRPYRITLGNVGLYKNGDMVYAFNAKLYPYKEIPTRSVVIFKQGNKSEPNVGMVVGLPGDRVENYLVPPDSYMIFFFDRNVLIKKENILSVVVARYYRND